MSRRQHDNQHTVALLLLGPDVLLFGKKIHFSDHATTLAVQLTMSVNPPTRDILKNHEVAWRTIAQHGTDLEIFDDSELEILKRFSVNPSLENQRAILEERDAVDPEGASEKDIGKIAEERHASLALYVIARYGRVEESNGTLYPREWEELRGWFEGENGQDKGKL